MRGKPQRLGSALVSSGDLVSFDSDLTENDFGKESLLGGWRIARVSEGEEVEPGDGVVEGGFIREKRANLIGRGVEDGVVEPGAVEVVAESIATSSATEAAARDGEAKPGIGGPPVGPSFEDVEGNGGREFGGSLDGVVDLEL